MVTPFMITFIAAGIGVLGGVAIIAAFIASLTKHRQASWVRWARWGGVVVMMLSLIVMAIMTYVVLPATLNS